MSIEVTTKPSGEREVTLKGTLDDFIELHAATQQGRRTRKQSACLEDFGAALLVSDKDLCAAVDAATAEDDA